VPLRKDPELRLIAIHVIGYLISTELAMQHEQDKAAVDSIKKLGNDTFDAMKSLSSCSLNMNDLIKTHYCSQTDHEDR
jgi:hypothetical protein